jgi:hypothetical protein
MVIIYVQIVGRNLRRIPMSDGKSEYDIYKSDNLIHEMLFGKP